VLRWDEITQATRVIVARDGAAAVGIVRLADELGVEPEAIRVVAVDTVGFVRSAIDFDMGEIATRMSGAGDWTDLLAEGLTDTILVGAKYMSGSAAFATGFALGPGVISWADAVITLLERSKPDDEKWLHRSFPMLTSMVVGLSYTFRGRDGRELDRSAVAAGVRRLVAGLVAPDAAAG
jgi:predicted butyrate kinase (DUF1464 family)